MVKVMQFGCPKFTNPVGKDLRILSLQNCLKLKTLHYLGQKDFYFNVLRTQSVVKKRDSSEDEFQPKLQLLSTHLPALHSCSTKNK